MPRCKRSAFLLPKACYFSAKFLDYQFQDFNGLLLWPKSGVITISTNLSKFKEDLEKLKKQGASLYINLLKEYRKLPKEVADKFKDLEEVAFDISYDLWYSEAQQVVKQILPDRYNDFNALYKNEKRKEINFLTYTISDKLLGITTKMRGEVVADGSSAIPKFAQQRAILDSAASRFESSLFDIKNMVQADLFDNEVDAAEELLKNGFIRAAGAISGVVLEKHLKEVCNNHKITVTKKNPSIGDYNDLLKQNGASDMPVWRHIQLLADIRNNCDHSKDREPTKEEVGTLIEGVRKVIKTLF